MLFRSGREAYDAAFGDLEVGTPLTVEIGDPSRPHASIAATWAHRFGDVAEGAALCYIDSTGRLAVAINRGSAAEATGASRRTPITIRRA